MKISLIDLMKISEASKRLKQKDFAVIDGVLYGLDDTNHSVYSSRLNIDYLLPVLKINTRDLSAFIKLITTETQFEIIENYICCKGIILVVLYSAIPVFNEHFKSCVLQSTYIPETSNDIVAVYDNLQDEIPEMFSMKKTDGIYKYIKQCNNGNSYLMFLFSSLIPIRKGDSVSLVIFDRGALSTSFVAHFTVNSKNIKINIVVRFLKV